MPLANSFELSKKKGREAYIQPIIEGKKIRYEIKYGTNAPEPPKIARGKFKCISCNSPVDLNYIREESKAKRMGVRMLAIVAEGRNGRLYISPNEEHNQSANVDKPRHYPSGILSGKATVNVGVYGFEETGDLFTNRQLTALTTFSDLIAEAQKKATEDAVAASMHNDLVPLSEGGTGATAYGQAVGVYLAFLIDKLADLCNSLNRWEPNAQCPRQLFARQAIPMIWDFAEGNPFSTSSGSWSVLLRNLMGCFNSDTFAFIRDRCGFVRQFDAQSDNGMCQIIVSTDPPYYDNISYADLSDFFYVWMRNCLKDVYPKLFRTMLTPKAEELVATPYRFAGSVEKAQNFFEGGMLKTFRQVYIYAREDIPVTIYYAFKQSESDEDKANGTQTASTGWETMLTAIIQAGFCITGTWPMRTECISRSISQGTNALASSIVLVCRKRPADAPTCTRRDFINALKRELKPALQKLQASNIAPVDMAQSAIGPGMGVYSRYSKVLEADGTPMSVRSALQIINQELDLYFTEQDGELDRDSRFCVDLYTQYAFNDVKFVRPTYWREQRIPPWRNWPDGAYCMRKKA
jgi:putative DNA methylase